MSPEQRIAKAEAFQRMWNDEGFDQFLDELRDRHVKDWVESEPHEEKKRNDLWRAVQMVDLFKQNLIAIISDGPMAKIELRGKKNDD